MDVDKNEFYAYLKSRIGVNISDSSLFFEDLGIDGLEAELLIQDISDKLHVDMNGYDPYQYHLMDSDVANPLKTIWNSLFRNHKMKSFTALHLYNVVLSGRWFDPHVGS